MNKQNEQYYATLASVTISFNKREIPLAQLTILLQNTYWASSRTETQIIKSIENSIAIGAYRGASFVGFARIITDEVTFAYLCDVVVESEFRGQKIGYALMEACMNYLQPLDLRRISLATRDAHGLYEKFGFKPLKNPERFMEFNKI